MLGDLAKVVAFVANYAFILNNYLGIKIYIIT
jgi:hypothetical protein